MRYSFVALGKLLADPRVMKATATIQIDTDEPETSSSGRVLRSQKGTSTTAHKQHHQLDLSS